MEIVPHVGIGKVRLGMLREEADWLLDRGMQVASAGSPPVVTFIQVSRRAYATYRGVDVFDEAGIHVSGRQHPCAGVLRPVARCGESRVA